VRIGNPGRRDLWSNAVYVRGAMTLQALRSRIGNADFQRLLRRWVTAHRNPYLTASTKAFEGLADQISGQNLSSFFDTWLRTRQRPAHTAANGLA
jgi:aminopeptidase N